MAWQSIAALSGGNQPASILDTQYANVAQWSTVDCTAAFSSNLYTLTPTLSGYTAPAYANFQSFRFAAANNSTGSVTLKVGSQAALNVYRADGTTQIGSGDLVSGQLYAVSYNSALNSSAGGWYLSQVGVLTNNTGTAAQGFTAPINLQLSASVASNILTIAVNANDIGADPTSSHPVFIPFRDVTLTAGDVAWITLSSALSINTNATGATLGTANTVPFRLWVLAFNNGGTAVLALWQSVTGGASPTAINPLNPQTVQSTTAISGSATSAGVFYTPNGTTLSSKAFTILGYVDYAAGLTTAGTYASAPTTVQLFGAGVLRPGESVQKVFFTNATRTDTTSSTPAATSLSTTITPTSAVNLVAVRATGILYNSNGGATAATAQLYRGSTAIGTKINNQPAAAGRDACCLEAGLDAPASASAVTYQVRVASTDNTTSVSWNIDTFNTTLALEELMV